MSEAYKIVDTFEKTIADYAGAKYGVAVDSCCNALFLCLKMHKRTTVYIPKRTYPGVACAVLNAGHKLKFQENWLYNSMYGLKPLMIYDSALRFQRNMYVKGSYYCLSFHYKKHLPIGRGGMILTDDKKSYEWLKKARFDGRNQVPLNEDKDIGIGWNMYMTPEQASRGLVLFDLIKNKFLPSLNYKEQGYPDLSLIKAYK